MAKRINVGNLSEVEGPAPLLPERKYELEVTDVTNGEGAKGEYVKFTFESTNRDHEGEAYLYTSLGHEEGLATLKELLEVLGVKIPKGEMTIDPDDIIGLKIMGKVAHHTYQGRTQARVVAFWPAKSRRAA